MPLYIRDLGTLDLKPSLKLPLLTRKTPSRNGTSHLSALAFLLHHRHNLAQLHDTFHILWRFHVVQCMVHCSPSPYILVRNPALSIPSNPSRRKLTFQNLSKASCRKPKAKS